MEELRWARSSRISEPSLVRKEGTWSRFFMCINVAMAIQTSRTVNAAIIAGFAASGLLNNLSCDDFVNRMRMTDSSRMFVVNRVTLLGFNLPIPVEIEEFGLSKKADTKGF